MKTIKTWLTTIVVLLCSIPMNAQDFEVDGNYSNSIQSSLTVTGAYTFDSSWMQQKEGKVQYVDKCAVADVDNTTKENRIQRAITNIKPGCYIFCSSAEWSLNRIIALCSRQATLNNGKIVDALAWGTFKEGPEFLWKVEAVEGKPSEYRMINMANGKTHVRLGQVGNSILEKNDTATVCFDWRSDSSIDANGNKVVSFNIRSSSQPEDDYYYLHCGGHQLGKGTGSWVIGWSDSNYTRWYMFPVENDEMLTASGAGEVDGINYWFSHKNEAFVLKRDSSEYSGQIIIPESVEHNGFSYNVVGVADSAFYGCSALTSITLPNGLTSIGSSAFSGCTALNSITIPLSVTNIDVSVFEGCTMLPTENSVRYADKWAVSVTDKSLTTHTLRDNTIGIADQTFSQCPNLTSIILPSGLTSIGSSAFSGCSGLTSIILPNGLTSIGSSAFENCSSLNSVILPNALTCISVSAFSGCRGLTSIALPDSLTSIGAKAFYKCSGLTSIILPNALTSIGSDAFYGCSKLDLVVNFSNLDKIFEGSSDQGYVAYYASRVIDVDGKVGDFVFRETEGKYYLAVYIGSDSVIALPENYKGSKYIIDSSAFRHWDSLISVTIPNSVTSIGSRAFDGCSALTSVTIGNSVDSIGNSAFSGCSGLASVHISDIAAWCNIAFDGSSSNPLSYAHHLYMNGEEVKDLVIPNGVDSIGDYAFDECSGLTSVTIPNSVTSIGSNAFGGCSGLTSVHMFDIAAWCNIDFDGASSNPLIYAHHLYLNGEEVKDLVIPNSVDSIGDYAFDGCSGLTSVIIPNSVDYIGSYAFSGCNRLAVVINLSDLDISRGSKSHGYVAYYAERVYNADEMVGDYAFKESDGKNYLVRYVGDDKSITLPENYKDNNYNIGDEAFYGCGFLTSIVIPNSVQVIGNDAFYGCKLSSLTIGTGVRSIGSSSSESNKPKKVFWLPSSCPDGYKKLDGELNYVPNDQYYVSNRKIYPYLSSMFEVNNMKYVPVSPAERTCDLLDCIYDSLGSVVEIEETVSYKGIPMTVQSVGAQTFYGLKNIKEVYVSSSVQESAFADCDSLTKVTFGDNAKIIGASAFEGCSSLSDVKIGTNVRSIEDNAFKDCSYLNNIEIADSVENIGVSAFSGCSSLSAIAIPQATETIKSGAFSGCSSLRNIIIEDRASKLTFGGKNVFDGCPLDSVYIGGKINGTPFSVNKSLRSVAFANNVDSIYAEEFYGCSNLKNVAMGDAVSSIGYQAFSGCSSLESFTFASAMKTIGGKAFSGCTSMTSLISLATTPPICGNLALDDIDKWSCVLKVPESSISAYQAADGWKEFFFIESLPTAITEITEDGNHCNGTNVYTIGGMKVTNTGKLSKGIYIVDGKKVIID